MAALRWAGRSGLGRPSVVRYLILPGVVGLVATWAIYTVTSRPAQKAEPTAVAVVAAKALPAKHVLTAADLKLAPVPVSLAPGATTTLTGAEGRVTIAPLAPGQIVYGDDLAQPGNSAALSYHVPAGMRAETIQVTNVSGLDGMIQPGDHVDIVAVLPSSVAGADEARLILQHALILAVGANQQAPQSRGHQATAYTSVSLALSPRNAVLLAYAAARGSLQLLLDPATGALPQPVIIISSQAFH